MASYFIVQALFTILKGDFLFTYKSNFVRKDIFHKSEKFFIGVKKIAQRNTRFFKKNYDSKFINFMMRKNLIRLPSWVFCFYVLKTLICITLKSM